MKKIDLGALLFQQKKVMMKQTDIANLSESKAGKGAFFNKLQTALASETIEEDIELSPFIEEAEIELMNDQGIEELSMEQLIQKLEVEDLEEEEAKEPFVKEKDLKVVTDDTLNLNPEVKGENLIAEALNDLIDLNEIDEEWLQELSLVLTQLSQHVKGQGEEKTLHVLAKSLYRLMQQYQTLPQKVQQAFLDGEIELDIDEDTLQVFRDVAKAMAKRTTLQKQNVYNTHSKVTIEDIERWLQQSLTKHSFQTHVRTNVNVQSINQPLPMSTVEQYTLYLSETDRVEAISRQLVSELSQIVQRSQFLKQPGINQLTLTLRPQSLGDVTIRLQQVNGEMTVKFLVTTQVARELFEANLHQLKPMFTPNNVVVERDASVPDDEFFQEYQEENLDEEQDEQKEEESQKSKKFTDESTMSFDDFLQLLSKEAT